MKKSNIVLFAVVGLAGLFAGCGGDSGGVTFTEDEYCNQRAVAECDKLACAFDPAGKASCKTIRKAVCVQEANSLKAPPKRVFREGRGKECVAASKSLFTSVIPAKDWKSLRDTCARTFEGLAKSTEVCEVSLDCESGLICDKGSCGKVVTVGKDAGCSNPGEQCGPGQVCTLAGTFSKCADRAALNAACNATTVCAETLRCQAGTCAERLPLGTACVSDAECELALVCDPYLGKCSNTVNLATQCSALSGVGGGTAGDAAVGG